ncbi:hypothetical protein C0J52_10859 [Blattella germanica]|nr:hypothetical protein C0J52_10859 [Blattella germanica]
MPSITNISTKVIWRSECLLEINSIFPLMLSGFNIVLLSFNLTHSFLCYFWNAQECIGLSKCEDLSCLNVYLLPKIVTKLVYVINYELNW